MANRYWVGGTGNWTDTAHWSDSTGGAGGFSVPTNADNTYFDANSGGGTATQNSATMNTINLDFTGYTGTFAGSSASNIWGSLTLAAGMTRTYSGSITFKATSTGQTITLAGKTLASDCTFDGVGGGWTLQDNFSNGTKAIVLTNGSLDLNGQTVTLDQFLSSNSNTRTLTMGAATVYVATGWSCSTSTNMTLTANTSTIICNAAGNINFLSGGLTYYNVQNGTGTNAGSIVMTGAGTFNNLTLNAKSGLTHYMSINASITVNGTFSASGNSAAERRFIYSVSDYTTRTITAATTSLTDVDFQDITGAGAAAWTGTRIGDCQGNSGITFTAGANKYWVTVTGGNLIDAGVANWATSSGGGGGGTNSPLPQDTMIFDANSITSGGRTITFNHTRIGGFTTTNVANNPTFSFTTGLNCFGDITLSAGITMGGTQTISARYRAGAKSITMAGKTWGGAFIVDVGTGSFTFNDNFAAAGTLTITRGTLTVDGDVAASAFATNNSNTRALNMGTGTWTLSGTSTPWDITTSTNLTLDAETSTIKFTNTGAITFAGGGKTYRDVWFAHGAGAGIITISGNNTYNLFKDDGTAAHQIKFTAASTQTIASWSVTGNAGQEITINSTTTGTHALVYNGVGTVSADYLNIQHSVATPANTWYAGANSTNNQATATAGSGWIFTVPPSGMAGAAMVGFPF